MTEVHNVEGDGSIVAFAPPSRHREIIEKIAEDRRRPRSVSRRDLVPPHVCEFYDRLWAAEHKEMLEREALASRPGLLRRVWRAIVS